MLTVTNHNNEGSMTNSNVTPSSHSPLEWLSHWVNRRGNETFLTQPLADGSVIDYSWQDVDHQARCLATYLKSQNFPPASQIALCSKNCAQWIIADLAIWMAGHISVPLYPTLAADTVRQILEHSEARLLFVGKLDDWDMMQPGVPEGMPCVAFDLAPSQVQAPRLGKIIEDSAPLPDAELDRRKPEDLATIVYTSGSTGAPKGVMHSFGTMSAAVESCSQRLTFAERERALSYLPLAHVAERLMVEVDGLFFGFHIFFSESLQTFPADLRRARPTVFFSVPRLWIRFRLGVLEKMPEPKLNRLLRIPILSGVVKKKILKQLGLDHVKYAVTGSAPLPQAVLDWYRRLGLTMLEGYGMSENFALSHSTLPGEKIAGTVGRAYPGIDHRIADDGEIQIRSPNNMLGYFKDADKTAEAHTEDGWFRTGDRGHIDDDGYLFITGRTKELFKTAKGKYVAPAPIENKLAANAMIEAACVTGAGHPQPFALAMLSEGLPTDTEARAGQSATLQQLLKQTNAGLDPHEHLAFIVVVKDRWGIEDGALTPTMKIKRDVIESRYSPLADAWYKARKPVIWQ